MTERLTTLLHREAESLDVPPPPTTAILGSGRRLRRRHSRALWAGSALALVVAGGATVVLTGGDGRTATPVEPASVGPAAGVPFAWAAGDTVYVGSDARAVQMPEVAQALYYTSAGLVVRTNKNGSSDGGAPFHFELVSNDGTATRLGVTLGEVVPSTDPAEPYLAWATMTDGRIQVVVHDVTTDQDVARVEVPGTFDWGGWSAPPVVLSGDQVYVGTDRQAEVVDWRTGVATSSDHVPGSTFPSVDGGRVLITDRSHSQVVDATTGRVLLDVPDTFFVQLSPDGRFLTASEGMGDTPQHGQGSFTVYDVATGAKVGLPASQWGYGWTLGGNDLYTVRGTTLTTCDATSGACHDTTVPAVGHSGQVRYPGILYES